MKATYRPNKSERVRVIGYAAYFPSQESAEYVAEIVRTRKHGPNPYARAAQDRHGWAVQLSPSGDLMDQYGRSANAAMMQAFDRAGE